MRGTELVTGQRDGAHYSMAHYGSPDGIVAGGRAWLPWEQRRKDTGKPGEDLAKPYTRWPGKDWELGSGGGI